jgi:NADPH:quinone reductase-like Zn-dependent oxidoreductase
MASLPSTYQAFRRTVGENPTRLERTTENLPKSLKPNDVLIKIHAVSLNYRDVAMMNGKYPVKVIDHGVPASDCGAEVVKIGSDVHDFKVGDHVAPIFDNANLTGTEDEGKVLGGDIDGVLREYAVFDQSVLYHLPKDLSWEEVRASASESSFCKVLTNGIGFDDYLCWRHSMELSSHATKEWYCSSARYVSL